jgi:hypothetical protein
MLRADTDRRDGLQHAVVRLAQYWIQRNTTGSSFRNFGDADGQRLFVDLRKAVVSSTPAVLAQDTTRARVRITQM